MSPDPSDDPGRPDPDHDDEHAFAEHRAAVEADLSNANETLDRVRREMPFRKALWAYRLYYIGLMSSVGSLIAGCVGDNSAPMVVIPIALPLAVLGYVYGHFQLRREYRAYMGEASTRVWHSRRDRKNLWQSSIFRDSFMGRVRLGQALTSTGATANISPVLKLR